MLSLSVILLKCGSTGLILFHLVVWCQTDKAAASDTSDVRPRHTSHGHNKTIFDTYSDITFSYSIPNKTHFRDSNGPFHTQNLAKPERLHPHKTRDASTHQYINLNSSLAKPPHKKTIDVIIYTCPIPS